MGYIWGKNSSQQCNWLQFADDVAIVAHDTKSAQGLINLFTAWCDWAHFKVRIDKCCIFGALKKRGKYEQILPTVSIGAEHIPPVVFGEDFKYLGRYFNFTQNLNKIKAELIEKVTDLLKITDSLKIKPQTKIKILSDYIPSQISFHLRLYQLPITWVSENLDAVSIRYVRFWLETPISSCVKEWLITPKNKLGYGVASFSNLSEKLQLGKRIALMKSKHDEIKLLWEDSSNNAIRYDSLINHNSIQASQKNLVTEQRQKATDHFLSLDYQGIIPRHVIEHISVSAIKSWTLVRSALPGNLFNFVGKALLSQLPTNANLYRWGRSQDKNCPLCSQPQTNKHVLSNCGNPAALSRYTERHDKVLEIILSWLVPKAKPNWKIFADINFNSVFSMQDLFVTLRPDIAIIIGNKINVLELTICHETNFVKSKTYKLNKYKNIDACLRDAFRDYSVSVYTIETSTLGFISNLNDFCGACRIDKPDSNIIRDIIVSTLHHTFHVYTMRNSE